MVSDIWRSFRAMTLWVQIWVAVILVPVNLASLILVGEPNGWLIAVFAVGGMTPNLPIMMVERGFSKAMALPHVVVWTPLVIGITVWLSKGGPDSQLLPQYLPILLAVNILSLAFDYKDSWQWINGARGVAGR